MLTLRTKKISRENFEKFGRLVSMPSDKPTAQGKTYRFWSDLAHYFIQGETEIGLCTVYKQKETIIAGLERHLHTPEILIPIDAPFALPVWREGDKNTEVASFSVNIGQAVVINKAIWHGACIPIAAPEASYFVIFKRKTPDTDLEMKEIEPITLKI